MNKIKIITVLALSMLVAGCLDSDKKSTRTQKELMSPAVITKVMHIKDAGLLTNEYYTDYETPYLNKLRVANDYFDKEIKSVNDLNTKNMVEFQRAKLDLDINGKGLQGHALKTHKENIKTYIIEKKRKQLEFKENLASVKTKKKSRLNYLNATYLEILISDFQ